MQYINYCLQIQMGNEPTSSFDQAIWKQVSGKGVRVVLQHQQTLNCVQKYSTTFENAQLPTPQQIYKWRSSLSPSWHIVQVYQFGIKKAGICNGFDEFYVITQRVYRLNEIPNLSKPEALLLIKQTITALDKLRQKYGFFSPNIHRIGINDQGQVRVWVNQNYACNLLQQDHQGHPQRQQTVVNNLCRLIRGRVYNNELKGDYPFHLNFQKAKKHVDDLMMRDRNYLIDKIYKDRETFIKQYSAKRQEFSRTKSKQQLSQLSKGSKLFQQHSINTSFDKVHKIGGKNYFQNLTAQRNFANKLNQYQKATSRQQMQANRNKVVFDPENMPNQKQIHYFGQRTPTDRSNANNKVEIDIEAKKQINNVKSLKQLRPEKPAQGHSPTKIKSWGKKSYEKTAYNLQPKNEKILALNTAVQNKIMDKYASPPNKSQKTNKMNPISQKSQIRINNDLQEVDSVILVQDNDDSLLDEVRDHVPILKN